ncbi:hypothetical protein HN873_032287 [Arachis hypogaea]
MHSIPTLFFRKYSHSLDNEMKVMDTNRNLISLKILKGHSTGYIVEGFDKLVQLYRLTNGGTIKLRYLFNDIFYVLKVKDDKLAIIPIVFHYVKDRFVSNSSDKGKQVMPNDPFFDHIESFHSASYKVNKKRKREFEKSHPISKPLDIDLNIVPETDEEDTTIHEQCIVKMNDQDVKITKEQPMVPFYKFPPTYPTSQLLNGTPRVFSFARFNNSCIIPFFPSKWSDNALYYSFMCILTNQETNFAIHAFPSRFNDVCVFLSSELQYHMYLNWNISYRFVEVIMDREWRAFVRNHFLRAGSVLRFRASPFNEYFMGSSSTQPSVSPTDPTIQSYSLNPSELHVIGLKDVARKKNKSVAQPDCLRSPLTALIPSTTELVLYIH